MGGIQEIRGSRVVNMTEGGRSIQRAADRLLSRFVAEIGFGFQDGGCNIFAEALVGWSDGLLGLAAVHVAGDRQAQHVVARLGRVFLDSDGAATAGDLLNKMRVLEHVATPELHGWREGALGEIPRDPAASARLAARLRQEAGPFEPDLFPSVPGLSLPDPILPEPPLFVPG